MGDRRHTQLQRIDVGGNVLALSKALVQKHPVKLSLNFLGLALLFLVPGFTPSSAQEDAYLRLIPSNNHLADERSSLNEMHQAQHAYQSSQGWFWTCDAVCQRNKLEYESKKRVWQEKHRAIEDQMQQAKSQLGVFSTHSFNEVRDSFWGAFGRGMAFVREVVWVSPAALLSRAFN